MEHISVAYTALVMSATTLHLTSLADSNLVFTQSLSNGNQTFRMVVNSSRMIMNYKIGNAIVMTEHLKKNRAIFGSSAHTRYVILIYSNCFIEDSMVLNPTCQPWIWADNSI